MYTYKFTLDGTAYYFVGDTQVKNKVANKQGVEMLAKINAEVSELFSSDDPNSRNGLTIPHSTVLSETYEVLARPEVTQAKEQMDEECVRYRIQDCTIVNVYRLNGKVLMGTKNSWGINNSKDLYENTTYGQAFEESLAAYGLTLDTLPSGTYGFSNPRFHLMANAFNVFSFTREFITVDTTSVAVGVLPELAGEDDTEYIEYYPRLHMYFEVVSPARQEVCNTLYFNRIRFRSADDKISLINCMINFLCNAKPIARKYVSVNQSFNSYTMGCRNFITAIAKGITRIGSDKYYGVKP